MNRPALALLAAAGLALTGCAAEPDAAALTAPLKERAEALAAEISTIDPAFCVGARTWLIGNDNDQVTLTCARSTGGEQITVTDSDVGGGYAALERGRYDEPGYTNVYKDEWSVHTNQQAVITYLRSRGAMISTF